MKKSLLARIFFKLSNKKMRKGVREEKKIIPTWKMTSDGVRKASFELGKVSTSKSAVNKSAPLPLCTLMQCFACSSMYN